jgi:hypothetical protein
VTRIPLGCRLGPDGGAARVDEWRVFGARWVTGRRPDADTVTLRLADDARALTEAVDLAQREKACCGHFTFRLLVEADAVWLEVTGPGAHAFAALGGPDPEAPGPLEGSAA